MRVQFEMQFQVWGVSMQSVGQWRCGWWWWRRGGEDQQRGGTVAAAAELFWCQWPVCPRHRSHHRPATRRPATPSLPLVRTPALLTEARVRNCARRSSHCEWMIFTSHYFLPDLQSSRPSIYLSAAYLVLRMGYYLNHNICYSCSGQFLVWCVVGVGGG